MKRVFFISFFVLLLMLSICLYFLANKIPSCNDGTLNNNCSTIKPYFCSKGILTENASFCRCDSILTASGNACTSQYQVEPKNITLNYVLRGENRNINFVVYKGMEDYISKIPRYINSNQNPTLLDFKLKPINEEQQRELLLPFVISIENITSNKEDQARIAISIIQNIPFGNSNKTLSIANEKISYQRYPYEVLYDMEGICSEKSELLIFLLREIGYGTADLYYSAENHEAVGIRCPKENSVNNSGYCFVETTGPSIITDDKTEYIGITNHLNSTPEVINISGGASLGNNLYEYKDAKTMIEIRDAMIKYGEINPLQYWQFNSLKEKYGLITFNNTYSF